MILLSSLKTTQLRIIFFKKKNNLASSPVFPISDNGITIYQVALAKKLGIIPVSSLTLTPKYPLTLLSHPGEARHVRLVVVQITLNNSTILRPRFEIIRISAQISLLWSFIYVYLASFCTFALGCHRGTSNVIRSEQNLLSSPTKLTPGRPPPPCIAYFDISY